MESVAVKGALGHPQDVLCLEARNQIAHGFRGQPPGVVGVVVDVGHQWDFAAAQGAEKASPHIVGVDQVGLLLPDDPAQLGHAHVLHGQIGDVLLGQHLGHNFTFRAGVDHLNLTPEGLDNLADHLLRTGIDTGIEDVQYFHDHPSCPDSSSAASRIFRLRIP